MKHIAIAALLALAPAFAGAENPLERCKNHFILDDPCIRESPVSPGVLAFVSERDGNSEIYVVNADGTGLARLTHDDARDLDPTWSPDGKRIAFASDRAGDFDIYVMDADGSNPVRRTQGGPSFSPAWSPDGRQIAFSSLRDGQYRVYVMSADGDGMSATPVGFDQGWNTHPAWSPDGQRIAFVSDWRAFDFVYDVYVMNADGSGITSVLEGPLFGSSQYYFQPSWSPDGAKIAVVACARADIDCYADSSIAVANADGSGLQALVRAGGFSRPAWSPDGTTIAFSSQACPDCQGELRYVRVDGTSSGVILSNGHSPSWRPAVAAVTTLQTGNPLQRRSRR